MLRDNFECCVSLVLCGCHAVRCINNPISKLLYYTITKGEGNVAEGLLRFDENQYQIDELLIKYTKRMKCIYYLFVDIGSCTFSFANFSNPITQHMYKCNTCDALVCIICKVF